MKRYLFYVATQIEVSAPTISDAREFVEETFGEGGFGDLEVMSHEILDEEELDD